MENDRKHHIFHHKKGDNERVKDPIKEQKHHKHLEQLGGVGTLAAGAYALHEKHQVKKDPENSHKHRIKKNVAVVATIGGGVFALHERHEKKEAKKRAKAQGH